jgi:nucleotide-binding universal stress UspA family protein
MSDYPYLSLNRVSIDAALARELPRRLAYYYLALPLARDDDQLTVVMAHPDNQAAVAMLQALLGSPIVPVQGSAREIRTTLDLLWSEKADAEALHILCWGACQERTGLVMDIAGLVAQAFAAETICLDASQSSLETVLTVAREGQYSLTVIDAPQGDTLSHLLRASSTPVLLVRGAGLNLRHILLVLRGHSPDESVLDWVIPLAQANRAQVTLLTVAPTASAAWQYRRGSRMPHGLAALLVADNGPGEHIATCARRLTEAGITGYLKLREGVLEQQVAAEVAPGSYDLITIAAEAHGDFVQRVLGQIESQAPDNRQPVLVIKPIAE